MKYCEYILEMEKEAAFKPIQKFKEIENIHAVRLKQITYEFRVVQHIQYLFAKL